MKTYQVKTIREFGQVVWLNIPAKSREDMAAKLNLSRLKRLKKEKLLIAKRVVVSILIVSPLLKCTPNKRPRRIDNEILRIYSKPRWLP
jgi:hypothetical protein